VNPKKKPKAQSATIAHIRSAGLLAKTEKSNHCNVLTSPPMFALRRAESVACNAVRDVNVEPKVAPHDVKDPRLRSIEPCGIYAILFNRNVERAA